MARRGRRLRRVGFLDYDGDAMILVNEKSEAYIVDDAVVYVWEIAEGKTIRELEELLRSKMGRRYEGAGEEIRSLLKILLSRGLLKLSYR